MAVLGVRLYGDPVLTRKTKPVLLPGQKGVAADLVRDLFDTMAQLSGESFKRLLDVSGVELHNSLNPL
jgi:peptide deformylase